ncbi:MAG: signal peptidase II [Desulfovibrio sp.]|jgi:signal peptidase II|nr:signal peptidase II [Desulfovibrio sp.]
MRYCFIIGPALCVAILDQWSKQAVVEFLPLHDGIVLTSFFNLAHVRNYGAAFGFLNDPSLNFQIWLFSGATLLAAVLILSMAGKAPPRAHGLFIALGAILGGAAGNLVDRLRLGAVVDFLDFHYAGYHWPAFNVADIAICVGAALTALFLFKNPPPKADG